LLGERLGLGDRPDEAFATLTAQGTTVEGYLATDFGYRLVRDVIGAGGATWVRFPLLDALWHILFQQAPPLETLWAVACSSHVAAGA
ncbi:MAG: hypothetical protein C4346_10105, partial [Chloroflexota bacterium]